MEAYRVDKPFLDENLSSLTNQVVKLVGKPSELKGDYAVVDCGGPIKCLLNDDSTLSMGRYAEITGKVNAAGDITIFKIIDLGENANVDIFRDVVKIAPKFPALFPEMR